MIYLIGPIVLLILATTYAYVKNYGEGSSILNKLLISFSIVIFTLGIILFPEDSFKSASDGLMLWFNVVCPSLMPFLIGSKLLISLGIVRFIGALMEPIMRPIFNVPGCGSFPFVMSITSGYPVGSKIVGEIYKDKMCTRAEAQRLLAFCSTSGPLFMIGAVSIGMLNMKESATIIVVSHYLGALTLGFMFRFYRYKDRTIAKSNSQSPKQALKNLTESLKNEQRTLGSLLADSIKDSVNTLLLLGGYIVLFSVIIRLMTLSGLMNVLSKIVYTILGPLGLDRELIKPVTSGIFEITVGSKMIASSQAPAAQKIIAISSIIAWSGFSIHAQVAGMISGTDLKAGLYVLCKMIHGMLSFLYAYLLLKVIDIQGVSLQTFSHEPLEGIRSYQWMYNLMLSSKSFIYTIATLLLLGVIYLLLYKIISAFNR